MYVHGEFDRNHRQHEGQRKSVQGFEDGEHGRGGQGFDMLSEAQVSRYHSRSAGIRRVKNAMTDQR